MVVLLMFLLCVPGSEIFHPEMVAAYQQQGNQGQLPIVTTFIPSLQTNAAFRVSIHSWEKPRPSRMLESLLQPEDSVMFEARVFVDGHLMS